MSFTVATASSDVIGIATVLIVQASSSFTTGIYSLVVVVRTLAMSCFVDLLDVSRIRDNALPIADVTVSST